MLNTNQEIDHQAIEFFETILAQLKTGELIGAAAITHNPDGSFGYATTQSIIDCEVEATQALGDLMHRLS